MSRMELTEVEALKCKVFHLQTELCKQNIEKCQEELRLAIEQNQEIGFKYQRYLAEIVSKENKTPDDVDLLYFDENYLTFKEIPEENNVIPLNSKKKEIITRS